MPNCSRGSFWAKFPRIFPRKHFIIPLPPPPPTDPPTPLQLGTKQFWTSFVTFVKVFIETFWNDCIQTIIFLGIYWTSFVAFIIRITFIGTFLNLLRSWNTLKNTIKTKSVFSANLQFLMMSVNKKINGEAGKRNLLRKWFCFMLTNFMFSCFSLRWRNTQ